MLIEARYDYAMISTRGVQWEQADVLEHDIDFEVTNGMRCIELSAAVHCFVDPPCYGMLLL